VSNFASKFLATAKKISKNFQMIPFCYVWYRQSPTTTYKVSQGRLAASVGARELEFLKYNCEAPCLIYNGGRDRAPDQGVRGSPLKLRAF